ncbi:MAG: polymer-forming cytoskeletal protein [Halomonas sp.]|nr:polymer-forming cytoskeletal protein [Halomonas sp.]TVP52363.1 MAG: polymer-forming cytoskeletal protein [Halomonas sp.]
MFNKAKNAPPEHKSSTLVSSDTSSSPAAQGKLPNSSRPSVSVIGSHTQVEGDINSDEDLTVDGHVCGTITCKQHTVTLGAKGYIKGDVFAHTLHVSGEVAGNLVVLSRATIHKGAQVSGTIIAPCLVLEDGSVFHGSIDMDPDNDVLKSAFSDSSNSTTKPSTLNGPSSANLQETTVDKSSSIRTDAKEYDKTDVNTDG